MQRFPFARGCLLGALLIAASGCGAPGDDGSATDRAAGAPRGAPAAESSTTAQADQAGGPGVLAGRILFTGRVPPPRKIQVTKDVEHCAAAGGEIQEVVVSSSGGLAGAVVEIKGVEEPAGGWQWRHPDEGYVLRQKGCRFHPYLLVMPAGADLQVMNDDPVSHNVNTGQWNVLQPQGAEPLVRPLRGQSFVHVGCNIHSWMESWIYLARSPCYAESDANGNYRIDRVPPGSYRIVVWHPNLGFEREKIKIGGGRTVEKNVTFTSPLGKADQ